MTDIEKKKFMQLFIKRIDMSKNPIAIVEKMMALPFCHMHGPEHHVMVRGALAAW